ncbi:MAG: hypothetical protein AAB833_02035 [Patescibacteria group bacterium]
MRKVNIFPGLVLMSYLLIPRIGLTANDATFEIVCNTTVLKVNEELSCELLVNPKGGDSIDTVLGIYSFDPLFLEMRELSLNEALPQALPNNGFTNEEGILSVNAFTFSPIFSKTPIAKFNFLALKEGATKIELDLNSSKLVGNGVELLLPTDYLINITVSGIGTKSNDPPLVLDEVGPNQIQPYVDDDFIIEGETPSLYFGTTDDISGVLKYEVSINDGPWVQAVSPTPLENLSFGTYQFAVKAIDVFGNASFGITQVRVYPFGTNPERVLANQVSEEEGRIKEFVIWFLVVGAIGVIILIFKKIKGKN